MVDPPSNLVILASRNHLGRATMLHALVLLPRLLVEGQWFAEFDSAPVILRRWLLQLLGFGVVLVGVVVAMLASTVVWSLFSKVRRTPAVGESYAYLFVLLVLSAGLGALIWRGAKRRWSKSLNG